MASNTTNAADDGPARKRWLDWLATATALYPLLVCAALYGVWCETWWHLGYPPHPSWDLPKDVVGTAWLHDLTTLLLAGLLPGSLVMVWVQAQRMLCDHRQPRRALARAAIGCAVWIGAFVLLATDPGYVLLWFLH
jgi:hypothetical protein